MTQVCPYCASERVRPSGNMFGHVVRNLLGRPRFRCRDCRSGWYATARGAVPYRHRPSFIRRHPFTAMAMLILLICASFVVLYVLGLLPGAVHNARNAKVVTGYSGTQYTIEGAVKRVHERSEAEKEKQIEEERKQLGQ